MANDVKIDGGDLDGSVLENAATEATLSELLKLSRAQSEGSKSKASEATLKKLVEKMDKNAKDDDADLEAFNKTLKKVNEEGKKTSDTFSMVAGAGAGLVFSGIAAAGNILIDFFKDSINSFRETSSVGASFNNDLIELRIAAAQAALPLDEFVNSIKHNSVTLASFGGTVTEGAKRFANLSKELRVSDVGTKFMGMGYTMQDLNNSLGNYLEIQSRLGRLQGKTNDQLKAGTVAYLTELDKLAKATGISRKAAEDAAKKASIDPIIASMQDQLDDKQLAKANANMAMMTEMGGEQFLEMMKEIAVGQPGEEAAKLMTAMNLSFEDARRMFKGMAPEETLAILKKGAAQARQAGFVSGEYAESLMQADKSFGIVAKVARNAERFSADGQRAAEAEQAKRDKITEALGSFDQVIESIKGNIVESMLRSGVFDELKKGLTELSNLFLTYGPMIGPAIKEFIQTVSSGLVNFFQMVKTDGIISAITSVLIDILSSVGKNLMKGAWNWMTGNKPEQTETPEKSKKRTDKIIDKRQKLSQLEKSLSETESLKPKEPDEKYTNLVKDQKDAIAKLRHEIDLVENDIPMIENTNTALASSINQVNTATQQLAKTDVKPVTMGFDQLSSSAQQLAKTDVKPVTMGFDQLSSSAQQLAKTDVKPLTTGFDQLASSINPLSGNINNVASTIGKLSNNASSIDPVSDRFKNASVIMEKLGSTTATISPTITANMNKSADSIKALADSSAVLDKTSGVMKNLASNQITPETITLMRALNLSYEDANKLLVKNNEANKMSVADNKELAASFKEIASGTKGIDPDFSKKLAAMNIDPTGFQDFDRISKILKSDPASLDDKGLKDYATTLAALSSIDSTKIDNTVSAVGQMKTVIGDDFRKQSEHVNELSKSIADLTEKLKTLDDTVKNTNNLGTIKVASAETGAGTTTTTSAIGSTTIDQQNQLNSLLEQLLSVTTEMKDTNKDILNATKGRNNPIG